MARTIQIQPNHVEILRRAKIIGNTLAITEQLDRATYVTINKVLEALGGKWDKKAKAHLFPGPIMAEINEILSGGTVAVEKVANEQQVRQAFYTPAAVAERFVALVESLEGSLQDVHVLEPSCGDGALVRPLMNRGAIVTAVELERKELEKSGAKTQVVGDFLSWAPLVEDRFSVVVANPPFSKGQDAKHVLHALDSCTLYGGRVYAIMPPMCRNKSTGPYKELNNRTSDLLLSLPAGTFEDTAIATEIVRFTNG
jgi:predicted RNA methylase